MSPSCRMRSSGIPWHISSLTDVHTLFAEPKHPYTQGLIGAVPVPGEILDELATMDIALKDGPFRKLQGVWRFTSLREDACKVELELDFEFSGRLINAAFGQVFNHIANTLVDAFCKRAREMADE